ncbi:MAG: hypothetical protein D6799_07280 [Bacteroidetes bacterium]|nr:MAG: hypothetical protein D6799_07280 [Bacteroidota bacterium]
MAKRRGNLFKKLGEGARKSLNKLKDLGEKVINTGKEAALFVAFLPLRPIAVKFLKRRGHKVSSTTKPSELIRLVHQEMKKRNYSADGVTDVFDYSAEDFGLTVPEVEDYGFKFKPTPDMITAVIQFLKRIFDKIKEKKQKGEPLSEDEKSIAEQAASIDAQLTEAKKSAKELLEAEKKNATSPNKTYIIIGIAVLLILILILIFRRK